TKGPRRQFRRGRKPAPRLSARPAAERGAEAPRQDAGSKGRADDRRGARELAESAPADLLELGPAGRRGSQRNAGESARIRRRGESRSLTGFHAFGSPRNTPPGASAISAAKSSRAARGS